MDASNQPMLTQLVVSALRKYGLWDQSLVVGVSGGMDSMALLEALKQGRGASNVKVAHVNFKLRGQESDRDQGLVEAYCHQHGIECHSFDASTRTGIPKTGVQEWAREVRKEIFKVHFPQHAICLGHHRDDLAESVVFGVGSGAGWALALIALAGILSAMAVVAVLRALRYKKDLTRLTAQVQQLRK